MMIYKVEVLSWVTKKFIAITTHDSKEQALENWERLFRAYPERKFRIVEVADVSDNP